MESIVTTIDRCIEILSSIVQDLDSRIIDTTNHINSQESVLDVICNVVPVVKQQVDDALEKALLVYNQPKAFLSTTTSIGTPAINTTVTSALITGTTMTAVVTSTVADDEVIENKLVTSDSIFEFLDICDKFVSQLSNGNKSSVKLKELIRTFEKNFIPYNKDVPLLKTGK